MKKILVLSITLLSLHAVAADRSMTIFANTYEQGAYKDFLGDVQINENEKAFNPTYGIDPFAPVGTAKTSSVEVVTGNCGLLASGEFFSGSWMALKPGRYDTLGSFDNLTKSLLTYKMIGINQTDCNPKRDIPMLYDASGNAFPLHSLGEFAVADTIAPYLNMFIGSGNKNTRIAGYRYFYNNPVGSQPDGHYARIDYAAGGFSHKATSLNVPACYKVILEGMKDDGTSVTFIPPQTFSAGNYNLANYNLYKTVRYASAFRIPNCSQTAPVIPPVVTPPTTTSCSASGKAGQFVSSITLVAGQYGNNGAQIQAMASSAGMYCLACGLTSSNINNLISFSCGYGN